MKYNKYRFWKLLIVIILAATTGVFVTTGNYVIPLLVLVIASILIFGMKRKLEEKLTDERMDKIARKSSRIVLVLTTIAMAVAGIILISLRESFPQYLIIGYVLSYTACGMLLLYVVLFKFFQDRNI